MPAGLPAGLPAELLPLPSVHQGRRWTGKQEKQEKEEKVIKTIELSRKKQEKVKKTKKNAMKLTFSYFFCDSSMVLMTFSSFSCFSYFPVHLLPWCTEGRGSSPAGRPAGRPAGTGVPGLAPLWLLPMRR